MGPLIKSSKFLSPFIREPLKTAFLLEIFWKGYCLLSSTAGSIFFQSHSHDTKFSNLGYLKIPSYHTKTYDRY